MNQTTLQYTYRIQSTEVNTHPREIVSLQSKDDKPMLPLDTRQDVHTWYTLVIAMVQATVQSSLIVGFFTG